MKEWQQTDGGQRDEAEVSRVEERPLFPLAEEERAAEYVADDQEHAQPDGHGFGRLSLLIIRGGIVLVVEIDVVSVNLSMHGESHRRHDPRRWSSFIRARWERAFSDQECVIDRLLFGPRRGQ